MKVRRLLALTLSVLLVFALTGCNQDKTVSLQGVYEELMSADLFQDAQLDKAGKNALENFYYIDEADLENYLIYMDGTTNQAAEIALFEVKETSSLVTIESLIRDRLNDLSTKFEDYNKPQVVRIKEAAPVSNGKYIGVVVCSDSAKAKSILEKAFK